MLKGIIFVKESIISLDLQRTLSKHYRIVNVFKNIQDAPRNLPGTDFIILDADSYSEQDLRYLLKEINFDPTVNIVCITSNHVKLDGIPYQHIEILKPFHSQEVILAVRYKKETA